MPGQENSSLGAGDAAFGFVSCGAQADACQHVEKTREGPAGPSLVLEAIAQAAGYSPRWPVNSRT
jgi:hypothetical protein